MADFEPAFRHTLELEGVFSDHSWDTGGRTKYGCTEKLCKKYGYSVDDLTVDESRNIYYREFWLKLGLNGLSSQRVAMEIFDTAVNTGNRRATLIAQESLNTIFGCHLSQDGRVGPKTLAALNLTSIKYETHLVAALNGFQFTYYVWLKRQGHSSAQKAIKGWMRRLDTPEVFSL